MDIVRTHSGGREGILYNKAVLNLFIFFGQLWALRVQLAFYLPGTQTKQFMAR